MQTPRWETQAAAASLSPVQLRPVAGLASESDSYFSLCVARPLHFYHVRPRLFPTLRTCLGYSFVSPHANSSQNELKKKKKKSLESMFEKRERPNDETAAASKTANKKKAVLKRKYHESS